MSRLKLSKKELRTLDAFCVIHVFGECYHKWVSEGITQDDFHYVCQKCKLEHWKMGVPPPQKSPTTNPVDAMAVLRKCLDCPGVGDSCLSRDGRNYWLRTVLKKRHCEGEAESLEVATCLFARELFQ